MSPDVSVSILGGCAALLVGVALYLVVTTRKQLQQEKTEAEAKVQDLLTEAKDTTGRILDQAHREAADIKAAQEKAEGRVIAREEALDLRQKQIHDREESLMQEHRRLVDQREAADRRLLEADEELQRVSSLTKEKARDLYLKRIEQEFHELGAQRARQAEALGAQEIDRRAKKTLLDAIQRSVVDYVTEATLAVVELPSEDMKGRIIGREGRNIRSFEQVTGVDLIIDETPEAVVISSFDPVRRETARLTLMNLMLDGRIHPGRIEELYEKAQKEVNRTIVEAGERACERANVSGIPAKVVEMLGKLRFRTSYAQNVLDHSVEVARLAENLAYELGLNAEVAKRAGLLHDIGKALGPEWEGPHALTGMEFLKTFNESEAVLHAVGAHHHEIEPSSPESILVIVADTISASRPGARRENLENYLKRLGSLEALANSFPGVERSYAVQAGREVRLIVKPEEIDDLGAKRLAAEVAKKIEGDSEFPGQVKVTVVREFRATKIAK